MASVGSTSAVSNVTVNQNDTQVELINPVLTLANTEYSKLLPNGCKKFMLKARTVCELKLAYDLGGTATDWLSIKYGAVYTDDNYYTSRTIYIQSNVGGSIIEIVSFY